MPFPLYTMLGYDIVKTQHIFTKSERQVPPSKSKWEKQKNTRKAKVKKNKRCKKNRYSAKNQHIFTKFEI